MFVMWNIAYCWKTSHNSPSPPPPPRIIHLILHVKKLISWAYMKWPLLYLHGLILSRPLYLIFQDSLIHAHTCLHIIFHQRFSINYGICKCTQTLYMTSTHLSLIFTLYQHITQVWATALCAMSHYSSSCSEYHLHPV